MAQLGRYCKAYPIGRLSTFSGWPSTAPAAGAEPSMPDTIVFVQEDLVVTGGIYRDEDVIFDQVTPEWTEFCARDLEFRVPDYLDIDAPSPVDA